MAEQTPINDPLIKKKYNYLFLFVILILLILPIFTTFNEFLTRIFLKSGFWQNIQNAWVPYLTRFVGGFLKLFNIESQGLGSVLMIRKGLSVIPFFISWNCLGWQSLILIILTFITGLQGAYSFYSKIETIIIGLLGTFIMNIARISIIALLVYYWGSQPAVYFHNYGGTIMTIAWLLLFWWFTFSFVLRPKGKNEN